MYTLSLARPCWVSTWNQPFTVLQRCDLSTSRPLSVECAVISRSQMDCISIIGKAHKNCRCSNRAVCVLMMNRLLYCVFCSSCVCVFVISAEDGFDQVLWYFQWSEANWGSWALGGLPIGGILHAGDFNQSIHTISKCSSNSYPQGFCIKWKNVSAYVLHRATERSLRVSPWLPSWTEIKSQNPLLRLDSSSLSSSRCLRLSWR